jgi:hypothetical protein
MCRYERERDFPWLAILATIGHGERLCTLTTSPFVKLASFNSDGTEKLVEGHPTG